MKTTKFRKIPSEMLVERRECPEICGSALTHADFKFGYALKHSPKMIAKWFRAATIP